MLPDDLLEYIFQFTTRKDLHAVALSGRRFLPIAQRRIFSSIKLRTNDRDDSVQKQSFLCRRLLVVLDGKVILGNSIQTLNLFDVSDGSTLLEDAELPRLLQYFTNLRSLRLIVKIKWGALSQPLANALQALFVSDALKRCSIFSLRDVPMSVFHCSKIERLYLKGVSFKVLPSAQELGGQIKEGSHGRNHKGKDPRPKLRLLGIDETTVEDETSQNTPDSMSIARTSGTSGINRSKLSLGFDLANLHALSFDLFRDSDKDMGLLITSKESLNDLTVNIREKPGAMVDLSVLTNLQSLEIRLNLYNDAEVVISACNSLIQTISPRNFRLKVITFFFESSSEGPSERCAFLWEALDATLLQIHQINGLLEGIQIRVGQWVIHHGPDVFLLLQRYMRGCSNAGILHYVQLEEPFSHRDKWD